MSIEIAYSNLTLLFFQTLDYVLGNNKELKELASTCSGGSYYRDSYHSLLHRH